MKQNDNKKRVTAWIDADAYQKILSRLDLDNMENPSQWVNQAVRFYLSYLASQDATEFLSRTLLGAIDGTLLLGEKRLSTQLFRLALEQAMMQRLLSATYELSDEQIATLRADCLYALNKTQGQARFEDAYHRENGGE